MVRFSAADTDASQKLLGFLGVTANFGCRALDSTPPLQECQVHSLPSGHKQVCEDLYALWVHHIKTAPPYGVAVFLCLQDVGTPEFRDEH